MSDQAFQLLRDQLNQIQKDISDLKTEVGDLNKFKWKMYGAYALFALVVMVVK